MAEELTRAPQDEHSVIAIIVSMPQWGQNLPPMGIAVSQIRQVSLIFIPHSVQKESDSLTEIPQEGQTWTEDIGTTVPEGVETGTWTCG